MVSPPTDCHLAVQLGIFGQIHLTHAAAAKFFEYFVPPKRDGFADHDLILMSQFLILVRRYFQILYSASW